MDMGTVLIVSGLCTMVALFVQWRVTYRLSRWIGPRMPGRVFHQAANTLPLWPALLTLSFFAYVALLYVPLFQPDVVPLDMVFTGVWLHLALFVGALSVLPYTIFAPFAPDAPVRGKQMALLLVLSLGLLFGTMWGTQVLAEQWTAWRDAHPHVPFQRLFVRLPIAFGIGCGVTVLLHFRYLRRPPAPLGGSDRDGFFGWVAVADDGASHDNGSSCGGSSSGGSSDGGGGGGCGSGS